MKKVLFSLLIFLVTSACFAQLRAGFDVGYSSNKYVPLSCYIGNTKMIFDLTVGIPVRVGAEGENYSSTINWDEYPEDTRSEGEYSIPLSLGYGYRIKSVIVGAGIGYAMRHKYRNKYDNFHILGYNGSYYVAIRDGGSLEYKAFCSYYFPSKSFFKIYIKGQYSATMGVGVGLGIEL